MVSKKRLIRTRVLRPGERDDGAFDRAFWAEQGHEAIFDAAWRMVAEVAALRGRSPAQLRMDKSATKLIKPAPQ